MDSTVRSDSQVIYDDLFKTSNNITFKISVRSSVYYSTAGSVETKEVTFNSYGTKTVSFYYPTAGGRRSYLDII